MIRIGAVSYLNTRPLVHGLEQHAVADRIELSFATPSDLAAQMARGALDMALLPVIELARIPDLELVPGLAIGTHGASRSVLLVSNCPMDEIDTLALDPESRTTNTLARVLLAEVWKRHPTTRRGSPSLDDDLGVCDAVVRIGDKALFEPLPEGALAEDLGAVWTRETGLPFVFAVWAARPGVVDRELYRALHDSRRKGSRAIDRIAEDYTWHGTSYPEIVREYLTHGIRFRLGTAEIQAIERFFRLAHGLGLIERIPEIRLAFQRWTTCHETAAEHESTASVAGRDGP